jgi:hypothetical protein
MLKMALEQSMKDSQNPRNPNTSQLSNLNFDDAIMKTVLEMSKNEF